MNYAQGNTRSKPDGFLHIQNFTVTKAAGMAAVVYTHILDDCHKDAVMNLLVAKAIEVEKEQIANLTFRECLFKAQHGTVRFNKQFLIENFREAVHTVTRFTRVPVIETFKGCLIAERESLTY
ncbi:MAG: hypothetical protein ACOH2R_17480 [Pseudomonas sp.]